jgi:RNA polymerase sigma factor (TIGR02999 family)
MAVAAKAMRQLLIDRARRARTTKRGGGAQRVTLNEEAIPGDDRDVDVLSLEEALQRLAAMDDRKSRIVELRFFGGLTIEEAAEVLGIARSTVTEDWRLARAWLICELRGE